MIKIEKQVRIQDEMRNRCKDIVNCYEIENRTIQMKNQVEIEKSKENVKVKKKDTIKDRFSR